MFADANVPLPRGIGTKSPEDVARGTIRAIDRNLAEVDVAPLGLRLGAILGGAAPALSAAVQRRAGGAKISAGLAAGQRGNR